MWWLRSIHAEQTGGGPLIFPHLIRIHHANLPTQGNDPLINFCDPFFRTDSLSRVIEKGKKERERDVKYNLNSYINRGYIFLHEMIHVDKIVKPIGGKSIRDLYIAYRDATGKRRERKVYGPYLTKLLARVTRMDGHDVGYWIRSTADNMPWYAMAVYVEKQLGNTFPSLPLAEGSVKEIWGDWNAGAGMLQVKDEGLFNKLADNAYELADIPGDKVVVELKDIEFTTDKDYPEWYTNELKKWKQAEKSSKEVQSTTTSSPAYVHESKGDENIDCRKEPSMDDLAQPYVPLSWAESKIEEACEIFKGIELNPTSQRQLYLPFSIEGSQNTLKIGALWNVGNLECKTGRKVDLKECVDSMKKVLNSCDTGTRKYKHGGEKVSNCIVFAVAVDGVGGYNPDIGKVFECEIAQGIRGDVGKCACNGNIQLDRDSKGGCDLHKGKYPCGEPGCKRKKTRRDLWNH